MRYITPLLKRPMAEGRGDDDCSSATAGSLLPVAPQQVSQILRGKCFSSSKRLCFGGWWRNG